LLRHHKQQNISRAFSDEAVNLADPSIKRRTDCHDIISSQIGRLQL
jgi:hypothetical protein